MHLVLNASELGRQRGGNEAYMHGLIAGLTQVNSLPSVDVLTCGWTMPGVKGRVNYIDLGSYHPLRFWLWEQSKMLRRLHVDWYVSNYFLPPALSCRGAVVVHDLSFRAHPEYFPHHISLYMWLLTRWSMQRAACIITVSEFSRRELLKYCRINPAKVTVVYNGIGQEFVPSTNQEIQTTDETTLERYGVKRPYILAVGNIHPRKNLGRLLEAYIELKRDDLQVPALVWVGVKRWDSQDLLEKAKAQGVIVTGFIDQCDLPSFYRQAEHFVYPSLYEGFGLPPVEAMACGTPVITSNTTSLPEVVGDAAMQVDPLSVSALAQAMKALLSDSALRASLRERGLAQAARYTWRNTAEELLRALQRDRA